MLLKDFYSVESSKEEEGKFITQVKINKDHELYQGHFPGRPVTPGVVLMQLFKEEAERRCAGALRFKKAQNVKFLAVVDPNKDPELQLISEIKREKDEITLKGVAKNKEGISLRINSVYYKK